MGGNTIKAKLLSTLTLNTKVVSVFKKVDSVKSVSKVGTSSVGFGPIGMKFGMWVCDSVPHEKKWLPNCYSMFRAKSVDMVGASSVGFGPIPRLRKWARVLVCDFREGAHLLN